MQVSPGIRVLFAAFTVLLVSGDAFAKTRWSSLRMVPDADFLPGGAFTAGFDGVLSRSMEIRYEHDTNIVNDTSEVISAFPVDTNTDLQFSQTFLVNLGIMEWVNIQAGYVRGFTLGFKARILGETSRGMPSLAIGAHNLFHHKEVNYFKYADGDDVANEFYLVAGKSVDAIKTRFHCGIQTIPRLESEAFNPFFAIEKYFGAGIYTSIEINRRDKDFHFHLFGNMRTFKNRLEISAGALSIEKLFFDRDKDFSVSLDPDHAGDLEGPGVWFGIRFYARAGIGRAGGFRTPEDRLDIHDSTIALLRSEVSRLKVEIDNTNLSAERIRRDFKSVTDTSQVNETERDILANLEKLKALYSGDTFDPDSARVVISRITLWGEKTITVLRKVLLDDKYDRQTKIHCITMLGITGGRRASELLVEMLARSADPAIKIETMIALGKLGETRAMYLMQQMAGDPDDAVALTAQDVLKRLSDLTGAKITTDSKDSKVGESASPSSEDTGKESAFEDFWPESGLENDTTGQEKMTGDAPQ
jgi:hypothetical protein